MNRMSLDLSDGLRRLAADLDEFSTGGIVLDGATVDQLVAKVRGYLKLARDLENEVSRHRWNALARVERAEQERGSDLVAKAIARPGSNVTLFPVIPRPFADGRADPGGH